jgi:hypothetical protein
MKVNYRDLRLILAAFLYFASASASAGDGFVVCVCPNDHWEVEREHVKCRWPGARPAASERVDLGALNSTTQQCVAEPFVALHNELTLSEPGPSQLRPAAVAIPQQPQCPHGIDAATSRSTSSNPRLASLRNIVLII